MVQLNLIWYSLVPYFHVFHCFLHVKQIIPIKMLLQDLPRKGPFFLHSHKTLRDLAEILQESCNKIRGRVLQHPGRSYRNARKKDLFLEDLARVFLLGYFFTIITVSSLIQSAVGISLDSRNAATASKPNFAYVTTILKW